MSTQAIPEIAALAPKFVALRRDLHRHPELAFDEQRTAGGGDVLPLGVSDWVRRVEQGLPRGTLIADGT